MTEPKEIVKICNDLYSLEIMAEEYVYMIALNSKGKILGAFEVSHGIVSASILNGRELMIRALLVGAVGIILLHNHPSGVSEPSKQDFEVFSKVKGICQLMGIEFLDNIIIGHDCFYSFREAGLLEK